MQLRLLLTSLLALFSVSQTARAWDPYGHMIVCHVAQERLNPEVKAAVEKLLPGVKHPTIIYDFVTVGTWMDDIRDENPEIPFTGKFKPWHYITWGHQPSDANPPLELGDDKESREGNIIIGLKRALAVLKGGADSEIPDSSYALAILCHLVGDLHQPLHCASHFYEGRNGKIENDRGGNRVVIDNAPQLQLPLGVKSPMNLHAFWDAAYRGQFDPQTRQLVVNNAYSDYTVKDMALLKPLLVGLDRLAPSADVSLATDFVAWGKEGNALARDFAYPKLPRLKMNRYADVDEAYTKEAAQIAQTRLVLAGYRLAQLLNETLGTTSSQ